MKALRFSCASGASSALAKPTASKPSSKALARMESRIDRAALMLVAPRLHIPPPLPSPDSGEGEESPLPRIGGGLGRGYESPSAAIGLDLLIRHPEVGGFP